MAGAEKFTDTCCVLDIQGCIQLYSYLGLKSGGK